MSCHGKTNYTANGDLKDWRVFRTRTLELARAKSDAEFEKYVSGVSDRAWEHILEENFFTPENAETVPYSCWMGMIKSSINVVD